MVNTNRNLFVGLVTHENSNYLDESGSSKAFTELLAVLSGLVREYLIIKENLYKSDLIVISSWILFRDIIKKYRFTKKLYRNIALKKTSISDIIKSSRIYLILSVVAMVDIFKFIFLDSKHKKQKKALRQINISLAHMKLMDRAIQSKSKWALIVEDDIQLVEHKFIYESVVFILEILEKNSDLQAVNVSQSFGSTGLGMKGMKNIIYKEGPENTVLEVFPIPNTDTVCATLYRVEALPMILAKLSILKASISIPIDIKINMIFDDLKKENKFKSYCYGSLVPGFLIQKSLEVKS